MGKQRRPSLRRYRALQVPGRISRAKAARINVQTRVLWGKFNEQRLVMILEDFIQHAKHRPPWLTSVELAPTWLDHHGVDVVVTTDIGPLYLQVKSSRPLAERFIKKREKMELSRHQLHHIAVVIVNDHLPDPRILRDALGAITTLRRTFLRSAAPSFATVSLD